MDVVSFDLCSNSILGSPLAIHSLLSQLDEQLPCLVNGNSASIPSYTILIL